MNVHVKILNIETRNAESTNCQPSVDITFEFSYDSTVRAVTITQMLSDLSGLNESQALSKMKKMGLDIYNNITKGKAEIEGTNWKYQNKISGSEFDLTV